MGKRQSKGCLQMYYHGESIAINVHLQNNSNKTVKKLKVYRILKKVYIIEFQVSVMQVADICLFTTASYTCEVARIDSRLRRKALPCHIPFSVRDFQLDQELRFLKFLLFVLF